MSVPSSGGNVGKSNAKTTDSCVGIAGADDKLGASESGAWWGSTDKLSIRSDWNSQDDLTMTKTAELCTSGNQDCDPSSPSLTETYTRSLRNGRRHTLTRTLSLGAPLRFGVHSIQNMRREMEDAHCAVLGRDFSGGSSSSQTAPCEANVDAPLGNFSFFAVFDGHGGFKAAEFAGEKLCECLVDSRELLSVDAKKALQQAFANTEQEWLRRARPEEWMDGTTAAVVLIDRARNLCIVGNVGDSEVLIGTRYKDGKQDVRTLTEVHNPKRNNAEVTRITNAGGRIWHGRLGHPKINPQVLSLAVSRAIGDLFFKDEKYADGKASGLIAEPYIQSVEVCTDVTVAQFLIIGCDGLWDGVPYEQAAELVFSLLQKDETPQAISEALVQLARDGGSFDNITVMVVVL